jgi:uncharacterized membrane protein YesL
MTTVRRPSHETFATIFSVVATGLIANVLLVLACLPLVALLMTTDPMLSWPYLAAALPLCSPGVAAVFHVFREHDRGGAGAVRAFVAGLRASWRAALAVGTLGALVLVVLLVDVAAVSGLEVGVLMVPVLGVLAVLAAGSAFVALVAVAEVPSARWRDVLKASVYLATRRWYLTVVSLAVLGSQAVLFTIAPALALGLTAAPALYLVWANARYTLRPVLDDAVEAVPA